MSWISPPTFTVGEIAKSSDLNVMAADLSFLAGTAFNNVATFQNTSSTSYTNLATAGPAVTLVTGTKAVVMLTADLANTNAGNIAKMSFAISGATTLAASDGNALQQQSASAATAVQCSAIIPVSSLTAGSNTFTAKYACDANTAAFANRYITVIPLP